MTERHLIDGDEITTQKPLPMIAVDGSGNTIDSGTLIGAVTEAAPASDTASSGLNGRLQRIAQNITSLIAKLPAALSAGGNLKVSLAESTASQAVTGTVSISSLPGTTNAGQTAKTTDYDSVGGVDTVTMMGIALPASGGAVRGGTSTAPLRTDPTGATAQPITAAALPLPSGAATDTNLNTQTGSLTE